MTHYPSLLAVALLTLLGCGNDPEASQHVEVAKGVLSGAMSAPPPQPPLTRDVLDQIVTPVMVARLETRGSFAVIGEIGKNGPVATWSTLDAVTISLKDGVIVATRGLGGDLMAARVPGLSDLLSNGTRHGRIFTHLNGEDQVVRSVFSCTTSAFGHETIEIVEIKYGVQRFAENCIGEGESGTFRNDFWVGPAGTLRRSRQWLGEDLGYIIIEDPKR